MKRSLIRRTTRLWKNSSEIRSSRSTVSDNGLAWVFAGRAQYQVIVNTRRIFVLQNMDNFIMLCTNASLLRRTLNPWITYCCRLVELWAMEQTARKHVLACQEICRARNVVAVKQAGVCRWAKLRLRSFILIIFITLAWSFCIKNKGEANVVCYNMYISVLLYGFTHFHWFCAMYITLSFFFFIS
jgi:hypothetical protein